MMNIFSGLIGVVFAAETFLSPLGSSLPTTPLGTSPEIPVTALGKLLSFVPPTPVVLGLQTESEVVASPSSSVIATPSAEKKILPEKPPEKVPDTKRAKKSTVTIALLGDSMTDTLGPDAPALQTALKRAYPKTTFTIKNFGVGGENIDSAVNRITNSYTYLGVEHSSLSSAAPDVVVIESCGYNPYSFDEGAIDKHWLALAHAVTLVRGNVPNAKIVIGVTIAPNAKVFGDGAAGLAFSAQAKQEHVTVIKKYLENAIRFAKSENLPLADAYTGSVDRSGNGLIKYINDGDHIHYSDAGRTFFAGKIASVIIGNHLIE